MDLRELQKMIKLAKKSGLSSLKVDGVELAFTPDAYKKEIDNTPIPAPEPEDSMRTLLWSVQDLDPLKGA